MKNLKNILFIALAVVMIAGGFALADTFRLGAPKVSFSPSATVTKTAAYTLTSSDSEVKFTASSANIVATLPAISSLSGIKVAYKILKTDATAYKIVVTPASGDTIGGESTRYLIAQNAYMIISNAGGRDWTVHFESPYLTEDHEAGTYQTGVGSGGLYSAQSASVTLTASDCGNIISMTTGTTIVTLPPTVAKCELTIINTVGAPGPITVNPDDADNIYGGCTPGGSTATVTIDDTAGDAVINTAATAVKGDYIRLVGDGSAGWYIVGCQGIWAEL